MICLASKGIEFKAGNLVSVGSIGPLLPPAKVEGAAAVTDQGLGDDASVPVTFE